MTFDTQDKEFLEGLVAKSHGSLHSDMTKRLLDLQDNMKEMGLQIEEVRAEDRKSHEDMTKEFKPVVDFFNNITFSGWLAFKIFAVLGGLIIFFITLWKLLFTK